MSRKALVLLVCCCDFRDGAERLIPSKSLGNAVIRAFPGLFRILRMCAPRHAAAVVRPRERKKSADRRRRILISRLLIIRASVPRRKSPFPAYFKGFPAVSPLIPPYPAFLKYPVSPQELFELEWVSAIILFFSRLAWALFAVSVVVCAFECGIEYSTGRGNLQQCGMNIIKGFLAVSLFTVVPVRLYALSVSLQGTFSAGLTGYGRSIGEVGQDIITELSEIQTLADVVNSSHFGLGIITSPIMLLFCVILMGYAVLKVFFANLKRGGILLIQIAVGSLYMFSVPRGYLDGFMGWMRQVIGLCLTAFLQSTILIAGLMVFKDHALMGVGLMLSAGEVPRIAGSFGLDTTTKANITSAVYTAQSAVNVTRTIAAAIK